MGWNEPGDKNPWNNGPGGNRPGGQRPGNDQGPPDLDELARKIQERMSAMFGGRGRGDGGDGNRSGGSGKGGFGGMALVAALLLVIYLAWDMTHIVQAGTQGVVKRFGQYVETIHPGLNFQLPRPIETVTRVDVQRIRNTSYKGIMLTQDENIVDLELDVQYRVIEGPREAPRDADGELMIVGPAAFLFRADDPEKIIRLGTSSAIREVVGQNQMDFVLKEGRTEVAARTKEILQELLDAYGVGLMVTTVNMGDAQPPSQVQHAFNDAIKAREDAERLENEAQAYANDVLPRARGKAARVTEEAQAYRDAIVAQADGEAARFDQVLTEYRKAPKVNRDRLYLDAVEDVMSNTSKVIVDVDEGNPLLYLPLDKMMGNTGSRSNQPVVPDSTGSGTERAASQSEQIINNSRDRSRTRTR